jgi:hypothetical protein
MISVRPLYRENATRGDEISQALTEIPSIAAKRIRKCKVKMKFHLHRSIENNEESAKYANTATEQLAKKCRSSRFICIIASLASLSNVIVRSVEKKAIM